MANIIRLITSQNNTTSNETITIATYPIPLNKICYALVFTIGYNASNGLGMTQSRMVSFKNINNVCSFIGGGGTNVIAPSRDSGLSGAGLSETIIGTNLLIQTQGASGKPMTWDSVIDIYLN